MTGPFHQHDRVEHAEAATLAPMPSANVKPRPRAGLHAGGAAHKEHRARSIETHGYRSLQQVEELCGGARWIVVEVGDNLLAESRPEIGGIR